MHYLRTIHNRYPPSIITSYCDKLLHKMRVEIQNSNTRIVLRSVRKWENIWVVQTLQLASLRARTLFMHEILCTNNFFWHENPYAPSTTSEVCFKDMHNCLHFIEQSYNLKSFNIFDKLTAYRDSPIPFFKSSRWKQTKVTPRESQQWEL